MTTQALAGSPTRPPAVEAIELLRERIAGTTHPGAVASAAAQLLHERLSAPAVTIYRVDGAAQGLVLLGTSKGAERGRVPGSRVATPGGALGEAVRTGKTQRAANVYVEPDFVHCMPGETRSDLVVPIPGRDGCGGMIHLEYPTPRQPEPHAEAMAVVVATQIGGLIEGPGAGADRPAEAPAAGGATALYELSHLLARAEDLPAALRRVAEATHRLGGAQGAALLLRHGARQMLELVACAGSVPLTVGELFPIQGSLAGEVLRTGQARAGVLRSAETPLLGPRDEAAGVQDVLIAPVAAAGKTFGVLVLLNRGRQSEDEGELVELLQLLASTAGALESSRLVATLRQQLSDSSLIAEVGRALTGTLGVDEVLALVVRAAEMLAGGRGVAIGLLSEGHGMLHLVSTSGVLGRSTGQAVPVHGSLMGWAVQTGEVVITPHASDDPRGFPHEVRQGPAVVVPLESRGEVRGALMVTRAEGAPEPSDQDVDALRKLAAYAAIAIDNAQLYRAQTELSTALREQTAELERAYSEVKESQDRLLVSEKMAALGRLTAGIAHEINSPLGGVMNCLQLATQYAGEYQASVDDPEVTADDHRAIAHDLMEALTMAEAATRKVGQFVRTIKGQTRMGDEGTRVAFSPAEEIESTLGLLQHELRNRHVTLRTEADAGIRIMGDPGKFALVVQNLVTNAIDAYAGSEGEVEIRVERRGDDVVLEVQDHGCGIPEAIRGRIFDYLFTTKDVGQGTGLGLSIVHSIITTSFQGRIDLRSEVGAGTTFVVTIPTQVDSN